MNQLPCPGCQQVYPVPPGIPPQTPFTCQRCGFSSTLGALMQALQQAAGQAQAAQQGDLDPNRLPGHEPQAPGRPLAQMPQVKPSGLHAGGLDLADEAANPVSVPAAPAQPATTAGKPGGMAVIQPTRSKTDQYGNPLPPIDVTCPKCKAPSQVPPDTDMDYPFRCQACGHQARLGDVLLSVEADSSHEKKAKANTGDFFDDIPDELKQPTALEQIQKENKRDPRLPTFAAAIGILLLVGVPLFSGEAEIDPRMAAQGIQPDNNMGMKLGIFGGLCVVVIGGAFFLLRMASEDEEDEAYEDDEVEPEE